MLKAWEDTHKKNTLELLQKMIRLINILGARNSILTGANGDAFFTVINSLKIKDIL